MFELYQFLTDESQEKIKKYLEEAESKVEKLGMAKALLNTAKNMLKDGFFIEK